MKRAPNPLVMSIVLAGSMLACATHAVDSFSLETGAGDDVLNARAGATWHWKSRLVSMGHWHLTGYWEASAGIWGIDGPGGGRAFDAGFAPVFRLRPNVSGGTQPYWEAAIGLRLLSRARLNDRRDLGDALALSEHLGFGVTFGEKTRYDLGYRLQHVAGLREGTDGITSHHIRLSYLY